MTTAEGATLVVHRPARDQEGTDGAGRSRVVPDSMAVLPDRTGTGALGTAPSFSTTLIGRADQLAQTLVDALGLGLAVVHLTRSDGALEVVSVAGDERTRTALLGTVSWLPQAEAVTPEDGGRPGDGLCAPLLAADGSRLGVLWVDVPDDGRPAALLGQALEAFAVAAALALEETVRRERAEASAARSEALAARDPLTGIANRAGISRDIERAIQSRRQDQRLMALAFLDLDGFKQVNDRHSHAAGDHVLQTVAARLHGQLRPGDRAARWGGDEFLVVLQNLDGEPDALLVLERLCAALAEPIHHAGHQLQVTASVGVALRHPAEQANLEKLVRRADAAMYQVKRAGRNGIAVHHPATHR